MFNQKQASVKKTVSNMTVKELAMLRETALLAETSSPPAPAPEAMNGKTENAQPFYLEAVPAELKIAKLARF